MKKVYFSKVEVFDEWGESIKLKKDETFVTFIKHKRELFVMTTKRVYKIVKDKK